MLPDGEVLLALDLGEIVHCQKLLDVGEREAPQRRPRVGVEHRDVLTLQLDGHALQRRNEPVPVLVRCVRQLVQVVPIARPHVEAHQDDGVCAVEVRDVDGIGAAAPSCDDTWVARQGLDTLAPEALDTGVLDPLPRDHQRPLVAVEIVLVPLPPAPVGEVEHVCPRCQQIGVVDRDDAGPAAQSRHEILPQRWAAAEYDRRLATPLTARDRPPFVARALDHGRPRRPHRHHRRPAVDDRCLLLRRVRWMLDEPPPDTLRIVDHACCDSLRIGRPMHRHWMASPGCPPSGGASQR